jgi:hypothetical protein
MNRRIVLRLAAVLLIAVAVVGVWRATHATYGSPTGFHVVDGYWLGPEASCSDAGAPDYCSAAIVTATAALDAIGSHAQIVLATIAPQSCDAQSYVFCTNGGFGTETVFVVFDLADGSREPVGLLCQRAMSVNDQPPTAPNCHADNITNQENLGEDPASS